MKKEQDVIQVPYNFIPRQYQLELFRAMDGEIGKPGTKKTRAVLRWHRRAGKDKACWCYLIKEAAQVTGNYFYVFPTKTMARQALWENIDKDGFKLLDHVPPQIIKRKSNQEMLLEFTNGSTIRVLGYDKDPDSIRGIAARGVVFSEFAFSDPESYKTMIPALRESKGWAIFNSTPNGRNHFYDLWQNTVASPRWYASVLQTYWSDKPGYSGLISSEEFPHIIEEEGLTIEDVEREYGVSFNSGMQGAYFADAIQDAYNSKRIGSYLYDETLPVNTHWDIGIDDTDACWFSQRIGNTVVWIDYFEKNGQGTNDIARMLKDKGYEYDLHYLPHDADHRKKGREVVTTASELEESLRAFKVTGEVEVLSRTPSKQASILAARKRFPVYKFDAIACKDGLNHLELYHRAYDKRRKTFLQQPKHDEHSHAADAFLTEAESLDHKNDMFYKINKINVITEYDMWE
jgi:hypothetical protein